MNYIRDKMINIQKKKSITYKNKYVMYINE